MKKQKGITLIALIITIIVMLVLVGVTVAIAINGGLFDTADDATTKTEKHSIYDQIVGAMELTNNGTIKVEETYSAAKTSLGNQGMSVSELGADGTFEVTGKRGTYTYKITGTKIEIAQEKNKGTSSSIYDVAYMLTDSYTDRETGETIPVNYMYVIRENNKVYSLAYNEDFTGFVDKCEMEECSVGSKNDYSEIISEEFPDVNFETEIRDEVILWEEGGIWLVFMIKDNQEIVTDGKNEYIRNDEFDASSIDFDAIDSSYDN